MALQQSPREQPWKDAGEIRLSVFPLREKAALETTREVSSITGGGSLLEELPEGILKFGIRELLVHIAETSAHLRGKADHEATGGVGIGFEKVHQDRCGRPSRLD